MAETDTSYQEWSTSALRAEHRRLSALKVWNRVTLIERELRNRQPVELAQDSYYYGTAADFTQTPGADHGGAHGR